jgi:hypothetical protein
MTKKMLDDELFDRIMRWGIRGQPLTDFPMKSRKGEGKSIEMQSDILEFSIEMSLNTSVFLEKMFLKHT